MGTESARKGVSACGYGVREEGSQRLWVWGPRGRESTLMGTGSAGKGVSACGYGVRGGRESALVGTESAGRRKALALVDTGSRGGGSVAS